jgi:cobalt-zinc-cadmium efflux system outer membrane protein
MNTFCCSTLLLGMSLGLCPAAEPAGEPVEPAGKLVLAQALALAEAHHPALRAAQFGVQAADGRATQAATRPNPALGFEAENFGGSGAERRFDAAEYTTQIEQTLELGGKRGHRRCVATAEWQLSGFDLDAARLDIRAETTRRFVSVLGAQAQAELAREAMALAEAVAKTVDARVAAGKVSPMEQEKAQILLAQKRIARAQALQALATARVQLAAQWGNTRPAFEDAIGDLPALPSVPPLPVLLARLPGSPDVARWAGELARAQAVLSQARAARVPDLTVAAGVRRANETGSYTLVAGVSVPLPVFDRNQGSIREAEALLAQAGQLQRAAEVRAAADLAAAHQLLAAATNRVMTLRTEVLPRVKAVFDIAQSGYAQGKFTYLDVLDAQHTLVESQAEYIGALVAAHTGSADLERIIGGPAGTEGDSPREPEAPPGGEAAR